MEEVLEVGLSFVDNFVIPEQLDFHPVCVAVHEGVEVHAFDGLGIQTERGRTAALAINGDLLSLLPGFIAEIHDSHLSISWVTGGGWMGLCCDPHMDSILIDNLESHLVMLFDALQPQTATFG
jgi:hypothetical protein